MPSFGIYDGTDDEPEDVRHAREEAEAAAIEEELRLLREKAKKEEDDPTLLDPFKVNGVRETAEEQADRLERERIARESLEGDPFFGGSSGGAGSLATTSNVTVPTSVLPPLTMSPVYVPASYGDAKLDKLQNDELARLNRARVAAGFPPYTELTARNDKIDVFLSNHVTTQLPIQNAKEDKDAEEAKIYAAQVEAKRLNDLNPLGPIYTVVKSAATGAWEVIKDPAQGLRNIGTNIGEIFNPDSNSNTNVVSLPVDIVTGAVLTGVQLANANDVTRATTALNTAKTAAAQGRRDGVSDEKQAELDDEVVNRQDILDTARGKTATQGGAAGVVGAIGAAASGGTAMGTGAGAGAAAGAGGAAAGAGAAQGGSTSILTGQTVPAATGVGSVPDVGPFGVRTATQVQADAAAAAAAAAQSTPTSVVTPTDGVAAAQAAAAQAAGVVGVQTVPISEKAAQDAAWGRVAAAQQAAAQAAQDAKTTVIYPTADDCRRQSRVLNAAGTACVDRVLTQQDCTSQGLVLNDQGTACVAAGVTPSNKCSDGSDKPANGICPVTPSNKCSDGSDKPANGICPVTPSNKCSDGSDKPANGICPVTPSNKCPDGSDKPANGICPVVTNCNLTTHEVVNGACVVKCGSGQERNTQGVCVVKPGPGTTTAILPIPSNPFTMATITADQRNLSGELEKTAAAFKLRRDELKAVYGNAIDDYTDADIAAFDKVSGAMRGTNAANTAAASAQTIAANTALRDANLADVNRLGGAALLNRKTLNSQLYGNLNQYSTEASAALGRDMEALRLAEAKQLSPEDIRNSQQAAREAWSARGLVNSRGAVGAEILNRDSLARQREAEARAKVQQSYGNLQQATAMEQANVFDPQAAILGGQYGMQTQNYGTNAALYGQSANQMAGSQNYVQKVYNPMGEYPNNIYDFNANATTAARISEANNAASIEAAREAGQYGLAGTALKSGWVQDVVTGAWKYVRSALGGS